MGSSLASDYLCLRNLPCCDHCDHIGGKLNGRSMSITLKLIIGIKVSLLHLLIDTIEEEEKIQQDKSSKGRRLSKAMKCFQMGIAWIIVVILFCGMIAN